MNTDEYCPPSGHLGQIYRSWSTPATCQRAGSCVALRWIIEYMNLHTLYYMFLWWMFLWMFFSPLVGINPNNLTFHVLLSWYAFAGTDNLFHWQSFYFGLWTVAAKATTNASLQLCDWSWASEVLRSQTGPGFDCLIVEQGSVKCHWMPNSRNPWHEH